MAESKSPSSVLASVLPSVLPSGLLEPAASAAALKVAIFGFGTVGSSVARILCDLKPAGLELTHIVNRNVARKRVDWLTCPIVWSENPEEVLSSGIDIVVELAGGLDPAGQWVRTALEAGKSVVTANKKLIAAQGVELEQLARSRNCQLFYGAAVAGGIPVIPGLQQGLAGDSCHRIEGILNGTCNFILSKMESGAEFADALAEAQLLGYAEADPTEDVGGFDARAKLAILARIALAAEIELTGIPAGSIVPISAIDFAYAHELNCTIRQISRAQLGYDAAGKLEVKATVGPMLVPQASPFAWSRGTENMVIVTGKYGGDTVFSGHGAGGHPTAVAVVSDLLAVARGSKTPGIVSHRAGVSGDLLLRHYIRFIVRDRPGIVAEIAGGLARQGINIGALLQRPGHSGERLPFVVTVEPCATSALQRALSEIGRIDCLIEPPLDLQILEPETSGS
ncbi:Homoserine dehydrogenase [Acidisarcina polymorpha]|uniref:Homoserine dehydrogenase n=1 Tax=Acidisarcina polymorpha TaxID=2211140 RepID=A0A2Z5G950_9BACT|nr:homoserine dehydrogenase [Acidisarcina polymorpha]AXC15214.1 Homoserine dehydrogenase [Acidisarcina polymorpha]